MDVQGHHRRQPVAAGLLCRSTIICDFFQHEGGNVRPPLFQFHLASAPIARVEAAVQKLRTLPPSANVMVI